MNGFDDHCWKDVLDEDVRAVCRSYHRDVRVGPKPALLLVDLYDLAYEGGPRPIREVIAKYPSSCGIHAHRAIAPTQRLLALARSRQIPVFYSTSTPEPAGATLRQDGRAVGQELYAIREELAPGADERVIYKDRASCFFGTPLVSYLNQMGIDSLIICGQSTSGCVRASAVDAYSYGFHTVVVEDCTFDRNELSHKVSLFDLAHKYADVFTVDQLERALAGQPAMKD